MNRLKLIALFLVIFLSLAAFVGFVATALPTTFFDVEKNKLLFTVISSVFVGAITATVGYLTNKYLERSIVRIEHVDFKSEREPFQLPSDIWWIITHSGFVKFVDERVTWSVNCFLQNKFSFYHLQEIKELVDERINQYQATANWTKDLLTKVASYSKQQDESLRLQLVESFMPDIIRFEDHYREINKSSLVKDLKDNPKDSTEFLYAEIGGLLVQHEGELKSTKALLSWVRDSLKEGERQSKPIDFNDREVPKITILVGASNVGRTPALIKFDADLLLKKNGKDKEIPLRLTSKYNFFAKIDPNEAVPLKFEIDQTRCAFEQNVEIHKTLIDKNDQTKASIRLILADGTEIRSKEFELYDNSKIPI